MAVQVKLTDNSRVVLRTLNGNVSAALNAIGVKATNLILQQMERGYGKPIRQTGDLQRDVQYEVNENTKTVSVGNTLEYGPYVHEGTSKMAGRQYIADALMKDSSARQLQAVASENIKKGF